MTGETSRNPQDRRTLKNYFSEGALPNAQHYSDFIDSVVTWKDDGFDKSEAEGWRIAAIGDDRALMSFYGGVGSPLPDWMLAHGGDDGGLRLRAGAGSGEVAGTTSTMALTPSGRVGVSRDAPDWRLDVDGVARMRGRIGFPGAGDRATAPADGGWHPVTELMDGCVALEVVAGVGAAEGAGRYALIHAIAMNAYNPRNRLVNWLLGRRSIRRQHAVYGSMADRLRLKWETPSGAELAKLRSPGGGSDEAEQRRYNRPYRLMIKTQSRYGAKHRIRFYVTRLWFDSAMAGSRDPSVDRDDGVS